SQRLMERGIRVYEDLFREKGILVRQEMIPTRASDTESGGEARTSLYVDGQLNPGLFRLPGGISSQFISGLLFALPCLSGDSVIEIIPPVESNPYIGLTIGTLKRFGVEALRESKTVIRVPGGQHFQPVDLALEGDWSNGAVLLAFRSLGHRISVEGLDPESLQGDRAFLDFSQRLENESFPQIDLRDTPDLGPVLFVLAAAKNGAVFTGIERLRLKESDRLQAMAEELRKFGAEIETHEHSAVILPTPLHTPRETLKSHNDHRVVMALTLLLSLYGGEIEGAEAVRKSYPDFFTDLRALGLLIEADQPIFGSWLKDL
ncbi:MAG: 3-phosphoshikimate 1-carboxyvinyltransferase, partial [Lachnospiraceae bacterium]|nr:3-phosphoshikimate 1-carboxyvinyltransferase [Lachnospiraceae bacterium]